MIFVNPFTSACMNKSIFVILVSSSECKRFYFIFLFDGAVNQSGGVNRFLSRPFRTVLALTHTRFTGRIKKVNADKYV